MRPDGIEAPVVPVLGVPRRSRDRARIALVAGIAVIMLGAGIGLAGNGFTSPPTSLDPSASASAPASATASPSPTPAPTPVKLPPPTPNTSLGCAPVRLGKPPEIRLTSNPGQMVIRGVAGPGLPDQTASPLPGWPTLPVGGALRMSASSSLDLAAEQDGCIRYVVAEYAPGTPDATIPVPIAFRTLNVSPPRSIVPLGKLPSGIWIVRVVAYFSTGVAGQEDGTVIERFFRVSNSDTDGPLPTPITPPTVPCAPPPPGGMPPSLVLSGSAGGLVEGTPGLAVPSVVPVRLGDLIEVRVEGDACAIAWRIGATQPDVNNQYEFDREDNPANNPFLFSQNRWRLHDLPTGLLYLTATIRFSVDVSVTSRWLLDIQGADVPSARIVAPNGDSVTPVRSPCGTTWEFTNRTGGYESCPSEPVPASVPMLAVGPETPLRLEVPGWTIVSWGGSCGRSDEQSGPDAVFVVVDGCDLGGRYPQEGSVGEPVAAVFLSRSSGPMVRLFLRVIRGDTAVIMILYAATGAAP